MNLESKFLQHTCCIAVCCFFMEQERSACRKMQLTDAQMRLYAITDDRWLNGRTLYDCVEDALKGGVTMLQIREKHCSTEELTALAIPIVSLCHRYHVPCIINDDVQAAKDSGADGVHVGQDDTSIAQARAVLGAENGLERVPTMLQRQEKPSKTGRITSEQEQCLARQQSRMQRRFRCKLYRKSVRQSPFQSLPSVVLQRKMLCSCVTLVDKALQSFRRFLRSRIA